MSHRTYRLGRTLLPSGLVIALGGTALVASLVSASPDHAGHGEDRFVVHEWGTFTSLQGSSGIELDGLQHEGEALPGFVHSFAPTLPSPFRALGDTSRNVPVRGSRSKMETPVIYFHSSRPRDVRVEVDFARGLFSHYYPAPTTMSPEPPAPEPVPVPVPVIDLARIPRSTLTWNVHLSPGSRTQTHQGLPRVAPDDPYGFAREVDAARVEVRSADRGVEAEQFLFYRGLGHRNPDVEVASGKLHNHTGDALAAAFVVEMTATQGRFVELGRIERDAVATVDPGSARLTSKADVIAALSAKMQRVLVAQGLTGDEARAMVRTWADQWFGDSGTRVLYLVPRSYVDRVLSMRISPAPDALLRVFVGRIEFMTPAVEASIEKDLKDSADGSAEVQRAALERLAALGRFLEPKLRAVHVATRDPVVRSHAEALLAELAPAVDLTGDR